MTLCEFESVIMTQPSAESASCIRVEIEEIVPLVASEPVLFALEDLLRGANLQNLEAQLVDAVFIYGALQHRIAVPAREKVTYVLPPSVANGLRSAADINKP